MKTHPLRLFPGQDLKQELDALVKAQDWPAACVLTGIGSLKVVAVRFAGVEKSIRLTGPHEIVSLAGTLGRNGSHLHVLVSDEEGVARGGHLMKGCLVNTTAEIVLGVFPDWEFRRRYDEATGYAELDIRPWRAGGSSVSSEQSRPPESGD